MAVSQLHGRVARESTLQQHSFPLAGLPTTLATQLSAAANTK